MILKRIGIASILCILLLSLLFNVYITEKYFIKDWKTWSGFSRFSESATGSIFMCIHWIGGFIVNILGTFQILSKTLDLKQGISKLHKYSGLFYLVSVILTVTGGLLFVFVINTAGGWPMDTSFSMYGILRLICGVQTWKHAGKNTKLHYEWATRLYSLGIGSMIYRILVIPVYVYNENSFKDYTVWASNYLITASWFFYFPNLIVAQVVVIYWRIQSKREDLLHEPLSAS